MSRRGSGRTRGRRRGGRGRGRDGTPPPTQPSPPPPQPPPTIPTINHRSAWGILKHAAVIFCSHPITFLVISFLLCSLRFTIEQLYHPISNQNDLYGMKVPFFDSFEHTFSSNKTNSSPTHPFPRIDFISGSEIPDLNTIDNDNRHVDLDLDEIASRILLTWYSVDLCATELVYVWLRGIVFLHVIDHFDRNQWSLMRTTGTGLWIGFIRIFWISSINMQLRVDWLMRILEFSGKTGNFYILLVIVTRWLFTPFMNKAPWVPLPDWGTIPVIAIVLCIDMMLGLMCSVGSSAGLVHGEMMSPFEVTEETFHLLVVSLTSAVAIRVTEAIICGAIGRGMLWSILGNLCSLAVQCVMEVFFLVAWVVYYLSARNLLGYPELVGFLEELDFYLIAR